MSGNSEDVEGEQPHPARNETLTHILYAQEAVGDDKKDSAIIDLIVDQFKQENIGNILANPAIASIGPSRIKQVVLGPKHIGVLLDDNNVCRISYHLLQVQVGEVKEAEASRGECSRLQEVYSRAAPGEVEVIPLSGGLSSLRAATGQAKYRRVMLTNRAYYRLRGGLSDARSYILGGPRPPAANVPDDLINQVQQVLQGKSREVIIRELQRTGLNVNEAVNNLLSRDDGDDQDIDLGGEHLIPEELLQILEGGVPPGANSGVSSIAESFLERVAEERLLDSLSSRSAELRYHFGGTSSKKPKNNEKEKKKKEPETNWKNCMQLEDGVEWWCGQDGSGIPEHALNDTQAINQTFTVVRKYKKRGRRGRRQTPGPAMSGNSEDVEGEQPHPARNETLTHILYAQEAVGDDKKDSAIIDLIVDQFKQENIGNILANPAIASIGPSRIKQVVLGPKHIGVLLDDNNVCRISYHLLQVQVGEVKEAEASRGECSRLQEVYSRAAPGEVEVIPLSGGLSSLRAATGQAKYRRVMLTNRAYYRLRGGLSDARSYILGGPRPPAANVPDDLINQVQQVLQGKSREVIIRELQRTGLNVNEAVNNLLSRDDGDDQDIDLGGEHLIPEELLQILEGGVPPGANSGVSSIAESFLEREERLLDSLSSRSAELRYHFGGTSSKKPKNNEKEKKKKEPETNWKNCMQLEDGVEWWCGQDGSGIPEHALNDTQVDDQERKASPIVSITATSYQMYVLHKNGRLYSWAWDDPAGQTYPMAIVRTKEPSFPVQEAKFPESSSIGTFQDPIVLMSSSNLRIAIISRKGYMVTWLDDHGVGARMSLATETIAKIPEESMLKVQDLVTSDHLAAFRIDSVIHWCGILPLMESTRSYEKDKAEKDKKKHVSFGETTVTTVPTTSTTDFAVGQHVQMKKAPLYPAGSVAAHINTPNPMIGVLLEDCWAANEQCRFRCMNPTEYDFEMEIDGFVNSLKSSALSTEASSSESTSETNPDSSVSRKRPLTVQQPEVHTIPPAEFGRRRVEVWPVEDLVWIHEHRKRDLMSVQVVDNNLLAVKYLPSTNQTPIFQSIFSERLEMDGMPRSVDPLQRITDSDNMRLLRKEDLQIVDKCPPRAPIILQKELSKFDVDSNRIIVSMVADLNELRVLARSKHIERGMHMYRVSTTGKVISRRRVPVFLPSVERPIPGSTTPKLITFGDPRTLFLRDTAGQLIPLQRDALNGFREPPAMHSQPILHIATSCRPTSNSLSSSSEKSLPWQGSMLVIPGVSRPWHNTYIKDGSSLMQMVLYCDSDGVSFFLDRLQELRMNNSIPQYDFRQIMNEQLFAVGSDLCSNVLHAAIRLTGAQKNADDSDKVTPDSNFPPLFPTKNSAPPPPPPPQDVVMEEDSTHAPSTDDAGPSNVSEEGGEEEEGRWSRVLRSRPNRQGQVTPHKKQKKERRANSEDMEDSGENISFSTGRSEHTGMPFGSPRPQEVRQKSAMTIVETLLKHPAMFYDKDAGQDVDYMNEPDRLSAIKTLLLSRDLNGMTPFQSAINQRAYGAAYTIWRTLLQLDFRSMTEEQKLKYIFPGFSADETHNADDSPLFILCYNDVCSFTWTGEDHINQDIYECKTCGLTGSLCCCSECALTCHRNHDCRLKRTSPTAYCDCWEKSSCKALINGNEAMRDYLLMQLLSHTRLYEYPNARNEHIMLFLARTVIRQTREQTFSQKRRSRYRHVLPPQSTTSGTPEHNLNPPKFAKQALAHCCVNPYVVVNSIKFGSSKRSDFATPAELHFVFQNSAAHLDKLTFALSNKHLQEYSRKYVETIRNLLSGTTKPLQSDPDIEIWASRFVRSLVRVLTLAINVSPLAPSTILSREDPEGPKEARRDEERIRPGTYQTFHAMVLSKKDNTKLSEKSASFVAMVNRIMNVFQKFPTFAVVQLAIAADAVFEPVRDGMLKPMVNPASAGSTNDPLDVLEKYFASDLSFAEVLKKSKKEEKSYAAAKSESKRMRRTSRRDTDRENGSDNRESMEDERSAAGDRASESHDTARVRNDSVATSTAVATPRRRRLLSGNTTNDTNEDNEERTGQPREIEVESSSSDEDNDDEEDVDDDDEDDDEDDDDDDDEDSERPADERQGGEDRDDDEAAQMDEIRRREEHISRIVEVPERDEEGEWNPYDAASPSPRRGDFDDNSSDSQEGGPREPAFVVENVDPQAEGGDAAVAPATMSRPLAENSTNRSRQRRNYAYHEIHRRVADPSGQPRIDRYYPYRFPPRSSFLNSRREESSNSQGSSSTTAANSTGGAQDSAPAASSTASTSNSSSQSRPSASTASGSSSSATGGAQANQESSPSSKKSPEHTDQPTLETAREQLALTFSVLVRAGCDILENMVRPGMANRVPLNENAKRSHLKAKQVFGEILHETFRWMGRVFESTEARINFNTSFEKSLFRPVSPNWDDKRGRKEAMNYVHSLLRLAVDDAKDALAHVEVEMLYPVALVADAYFQFLNCSVEKPIELKQIIDNYEDSRRREYREKCEQTDRDLIIGFFMRPVSLSWPGHLHDGAWDTISGRHNVLRTLKFEEECPMIGGPKILTMSSKAEELFREPNLDDAKRQTSSYLNDPIEEYTYKILDRPFEYRCPGTSLAIVSHRRRMEHDFINFTREFYHEKEIPKNDHRNFFTQAEIFPGFVAKNEDAVSKFKDNLLTHSCERENLFFSKWQKTLKVIGSRFYDRLTEALGTDVAFEHSIMLRRLASFETKYQLFNKATEKYRTQHSNVKEIVLDVRRESASLFRDTMIQLSGLYSKRMASVRLVDTPLAGTRLRVHFIDEPGEGTGVTRSFYTAFAESCMEEVAPFETDIAHEKVLLAQAVQKNDCENDETTKIRAKSRREQALRLKTHIHRLNTFQLDLSAARFDIKGKTTWDKILPDRSAESTPAIPAYWSDHEETLQKIYNIITEFQIDEKCIGRVLGIMCQLPYDVFLSAVHNDDTLRIHIQRVLAELRADGEIDENVQVARPPQPRNDEERYAAVAGAAEYQMDKLFEKAPYGECYVPKIGNGSTLRIAAFRTVGRIMGICLSQGDIFPLRFARHVYSFILKQPICWLDLGFYDPTLFNNLRSLLQTNFKEQPELDTDFTYNEVTAGDKSTVVSLKPNGENIMVNQDNVVEFVYKYAERVLVGKRIAAFEAMREGILDVIPENMLNGLTPEDLRLIICGIESVSISVLQANTSFLDESRASQETLNRFKQWFWQVIESFTPQEKQDLVFFWTGSPSLPATGKWQSSASVMLRPQEDIFLPTANTCISRLYVPVYSSKRMLRSKLLVAIKARNFGFV
ncbi:hypothetical protein L3Y34_008530 [Caenorhabditis briggsae]|uniref:E3 ubiquitin-protein ligase UBR5 n=1 Tax=Caenorhabditis briggsae TaxID=6238 RepID=A0AAE9D0R4_CAEBR|nr:hypothetical protein L3Y34_008530 [Caenorhabditis briggsae]